MVLTTLVRSLAASALLATVALPVGANPVTVGFEPGFVLLGNDETYTEAGFNFTAAGAGAIIDPSFCDPVTEFCAVGNPTSVLSSLNDTTITLRHVSRVFGLGQFSAAFFPSPLVDLSGVDAKLQLNGVSASGAAVFASFDLLEDGSTGNFLYSGYDASSLGLLSAITFSACFDDGVNCLPSDFLNDAQFSLDDLVLTVPEPGAAWLVALSLAGLALTRRRAR